MRIFFPSYYSDFKCIAEKCRHSCCVGWEIGVDDDTMKKYNSLKGELGEEIRAKIADEATIGLCPDGRCPFLDSQGLCRIISSLGDEYTSRICREHPRFYHRVGTRIEGGIGLSCEEAARIVLSSNGFAKMIEVERDAEVADESDFDTLTHREYIYSVLSAGGSYREKISIIAERYNIDLSFSREYWREVFLSLEYLDGRNTETFSVGKGDERRELQEYFVRFFAYLVFRHVSIADSYDNLRARVGFCLLITAVLENMVAEREVTFGEICNCARLISEEIEYSEENTASLIFEMECIL